MTITPTQGPTNYGMFGAIQQQQTGGTVATTNSDGTPISSMYASSPVQRTTKSSEDRDTFMALLVAQMKYQDPTNPADSTQMMSQTAQFSALEKMQDVADKTQALLTAQMSFGANAMVGRQITWLDETGNQATGLVTGVRFAKDGPLLDVNGKLVSLGAVSSAANPTTPTATTTSTTGTTGSTSSTATSSTSTTNPATTTGA